MLRLLAAGADPRRVYFVEETHRMGTVLPFDPARDMGALAMQMDTMDGVSLLILDPIAQAIADDSHKAWEVPRGLQPVIDLATRQNTAVIGISHLSKGSAIEADPALRLLGSVAFLAVTRVLLLAAKMRDLDGSEYLGMLRAKSNIGKNGGGWRYSICQTCPIPGIETSLIEWGDAIEGSAIDLMNVTPDDPETEDQNDAASLLKAELTADCWTDSALASKPLLAAGFTKKQIWKATKKPDVIRHKAGFGKDFKVHWRLPGGPENCPVTDSTATDSPSDSTYSPFSMCCSVDASSGFATGEKLRPLMIPLAGLVCWLYLPRCMADLLTMAWCSCASDATNWRKSTKTMYWWLHSGYTDTRNKKAHPFEVC